MLSELSRLVSELSLDDILLKCTDGSIQTHFNPLCFLSSFFHTILHPPACRKRPEKANRKEPAALMADVFYPLLDLF